MGGESKSIPKDEQIVGRLKRLAFSKNKPASPDVLEAYADILLPYPLELIDAAIVAIMHDTSEWFPPVGAIIAQMGGELRGMVSDTGRPLIMPVDQAWATARRTISAYAKETRPNPQSGNPAIDGAIREMGGAVACQWSDDIAAGIVKRDFFKAYERQIVKPAVIAWSLSPAGRAPTEIAGIEIPQHEIDALTEAAQTTGVPLPLPPLLRAAATGDLPTAPIRKAAAPLPQLPASHAPPPSPERRAQIAAETRESIAKLAGKMRLSAALGDATPPPLAAAADGVLHETGGGVKTVAWADGTTSTVVSADPLAVDEQERRDRLRAERDTARRPDKKKGGRR